MLEPDPPMSSAILGAKFYALSFRSLSDCGPLSLQYFLWLLCNPASEDLTLGKQRLCILVLLRDCLMQSETLWCWVPLENCTSEVHLQLPRLFCYSLQRRRSCYSPRSSAQLQLVTLLASATHFFFFQAKLLPSKAIPYNLIALPDIKSNLSSSWTLSLVILNASTKGFVPMLSVGSLLLANISPTFEKHRRKSSRLPAGKLAPFQPLPAEACSCSLPYWPTSSCWAT